MPQIVRSQQLTTTPTSITLKYRRHRYSSTQYLPLHQQKQASHHDTMSAKLNRPATPRTHTHWRPETLRERQNQSIHKHMQHI